MSKRTMIIVGVAVLALTVAGVTMAAPMGMMGGGRGMGGPMAIQAQQLTDSQQAEWKSLQDKNFQLKKERIN